MARKPPHPAVRRDGLQLSENRPFQERYWTLQRVAWGGFVLLLIAALLGLTGSGGRFYQQQVRFTGAVAELPRIARWQAGDEMTITLTGGRDRHEIALDDPYFQHFTVERITPEPERVLLEEKGLRMSFPAGPGAVHVVRFSMRALHSGRSRFNLTIDGQTQGVGILILP